MMTDIGNRARKAAVETLWRSQMVGCGIGSLCVCDPTTTTFSNPLVALSAPHSLLTERPVGDEICPDLWSARSKSGVQGTITSQ